MRALRVVHRGQIEDEFEGFDEDMVFELTDGTFWRQAEYRYWYHYAYRPQVCIAQGNGGLYLGLPEWNQYVAVEQIDVISSRISGTFNGWDGNSEYTLTNGQTWRQSTYKYRYKYAYRPLVRIFRDGAGYIMQVAGTSAKVRRV